jgi:hypothetical protein
LAVMCLMLMTTKPTSWRTSEISWKEVIYKEMAGRAHPTRVGSVATASNYFI